MHALGTFVPLYCLLKHHATEESWTHNPYWRLWLLFTLSVCCSRLYLGVHSVPDLVAGWALGTVLLAFGIQWGDTAEAFAMHHPLGGVVVVLATVGMVWVYPVPDKVGGWVVGGFKEGAFFYSSIHSHRTAYTDSELHGERHGRRGRGPPRLPLASLLLLLLRFPLAQDHRPPSSCLWVGDGGPGGHWPFVFDGGQDAGQAPGQGRDRRHRGCRWGQEKEEKEGGKWEGRRHRRYVRWLCLCVHPSIHPPASLTPHTVLRALTPSELLIKYLTYFAVGAAVILIVPSLWLALGL